MKFITDSSLNKLVNKINEIFRRNDKNNIIHKELKINKIISEKGIIVKSNLYDDSEYNDKFIQIRTNNNEVKMGYAYNGNRKFLMDNMGVTLKSPSHNYLKIQDDRISINGNIYLRAPFSLYGNGNNKGKAAFISDNKLGGPKLQVRRIEHSFGNSYGDEQVMTFYAHNAWNKNDDRLYKSFQVKWRDVTKSGITLKSNLHGDENDIRDINELHTNELFVHCFSVRESQIYLRKNTTINNNLTAIRSDHFKVISSYNKQFYYTIQAHTDKETKSEIYLKTRLPNISQNPACIKLYSYEYGNNSVRHKIELRAGYNARLYIYGMDRNDNDNGYIDINGALYFDKDLGCVGLTEHVSDIKNYTEEQYQYLTDNSVQKILLELIKKNDLA